MKRSRFGVLSSIILVVAVLYFAQEVLIPLVLALLLSFLLAPAVRGLERLRFRRVPAVLVVVGVAFGLIFLLGWTVGEQAVSLAENIPRYQDEIVAKVRRFRNQGGGLRAKIGELGKQLKQATDEPTTQAAVSPDDELASRSTGVIPGSTPERPLYTVTVPTSRSSLTTLGAYSGFVLGPLGTAALVIVFVIFMLLQREDMRDRMIRLVSGGKYMLTTRALNDAGSRISRYMLAQSIINGSYGIVIAFGLWLIGATFGKGTTFPNFILWGLLCAVLRFIPYIGPWAAAIFPIVLSLAVYPGFVVFGATAGLFIVVELLSNNVMEPWLYGASTGISTIAVLTAAVFWTWLWGPVGLLLSTPMTVCIVVLGKYVPQLKFLDVLLGDQPALAPYVSYYQRLLAADPKEAEELAKAYAEANGVDRVPDEVLIPALILARRDRADSGLSAEDESFIVERTKEIVERTLAPVANTQGTPPQTANAFIVGVPAHHRVEELAVEMLAKLMKPAGCIVEVLSVNLLPAEVEAIIASRNPAVIFVAVLPPGGLEQARYLCKRLRTRFADAKIVVGYWGRSRDFDRLLVRLRKAGASYVTTSLLQSRSQIQALVAPPPSLPTTEKERSYAENPAG
jgi:predicted PurR-regulated permease PerM